MAANLYDNFARIVKSFSQDTTASNVAEQYAAMTFSERDGPSDFMYCESNTWKLLSVLAQSQNKSSLYQYATVKQWVSEIPADSALLEKIIEESKIDEELEDELGLIIRKNRILRSHLNERPSKIRRSEDSAMEAKFEERFKQLRSGDLTPITDGSTSTFGYMYNEYIKYSQIALEQDSVNNINSKERSTWRDCVRHMSKDESLGIYGKSMYYALCGNIPDLCNTAGQTWEDVIWAYVNGRAEDTMDLTTTTAHTPIVSDNSIITLALSKDSIMSKDDPRILFHQIQSAILSNTTQQLVEKLYNGYVTNEWDPTLCMSNEIRAQMLRFVSTWILFGREYLGWIEDPFSTALLSAYAELNAQPTTFRPVVIASYVAKLSLSDQIHVFSKFLEEFDGDEDECKVILKLGKEYGLSMANILKSTSANLIKKAASIEPTTSLVFEPTGRDDGSHGLFFRAIQWLLLDENLALQAVQSANEVIRYFLATRKIYLIQQVYDLIPESVYARIVYECTTGDAVATVTEFDLNRKIVHIFTKYYEWEGLLQAKPMDSGSLEDLQDIYTWRDEVERQTLKMEDDITSVLQGNWLGSGMKNNVSRGITVGHILSALYNLDSIETRNVSKAKIRQIYIPEILIRYHNLLHSSADILPKNVEKCQTMADYMTCKYEDIFKDVTLSKRMDDVFQEFSKSLPYF